jgi:hypothetical protein
MNAYFLKAIKDIDKVLGLNKKIIVPYSLLMGIATAQGKDEYKAAAFEKALEISPASHKMREPIT